MYRKINCVNFEKDYDEIYGTFDFGTTCDYVKKPQKQEEPNKPIYIGGKGPDIFTMIGE